MQLHPAIQRRKSIRLKKYDYALNGTYFITICAQNKACLFGEIINSTMHLNPAGQMICAEWQALPKQFPHIELDVCVLMPNHIHAIIHAGAAPMAAAAQLRRSIGDVVGAFKSRSTLEYIRSVKSHNWHAFDKRLWQRNYYEHIIRDEASLASIREYIVNNPLQWQFDRENPSFQSY